MAKKCRLTLNDHEYRIVIDAINECKIGFKQERRYADAFDDLLQEVVSTSIENVKM